MMIGADALVGTLLAGGVDTVFANPGTSEMHLVSALDRQPGIRSVLALFEGVVTGAADGYARMTGRPAATLLHLGPGLANGLANLHNARKAGSPIINVVGDHATYHLAYDAPLTSDLDGIANTVSHWVGRARDAAAVSGLTARAIEAARSAPRQIATLILPADAAWSAAPAAIARPASPPGPTVDGAAIEEAARALRTRGSQAMLLLGGSAMRGDGARYAQAIAARAGCTIGAQGANARIERGAGLPLLSRIPFQVDQAVAWFAGTRLLVRIGAPVPVAFFAYPDKPSLLIPPDCEVVDGAPGSHDPLQSLQALAAALGVTARDLAPVAKPVRLAMPSGPLDHDGIARAIAATLPDNAIVVDESITTGRQIYPLTATSPRHDWLNNMGGSIGYGLPVALGAAVASPGRKLLAMIGDGSAFYTEQALWSMAREGLDITVVIFANRSYAILRNEWQKIGAGPAGERARDMLTLNRPDPDWVALARGHGMAGERVTDAEGLATALARRFASPGPGLIEAWM